MRRRRRRELTQRRRWRRRARAVERSSPPKQPPHPVQLPLGFERVARAAGGVASGERPRPCGGGGGRGESGAVIGISGGSERAHQLLTQSTLQIPLPMLQEHRPAPLARPAGWHGSSCVPRAARRRRRHVGSAGACAQHPLLPPMPPPLPAGGRNSVEIVAEVRRSQMCPLEEQEESPRVRGWCDVAATGIHPAPRPRWSRQRTRPPTLREGAL